MLNKLKYIIALSGGQSDRSQYALARVYRPEQPLGFVPRSDPNYYFLHKKF